jgi:hypothetical protein
MSCRSRVVARVLPFAMVLGCGGTQSPPAGPSPEPSFESGTVVTVRSGETDQAVSGATVSLSGRSPAGEFSASLTTDAAGRFVLDRSVFRSPLPLLEVTAPGFLVRSTLLRPDEATLTLWPAASGTGLDETFSSTTLYSASACPAVNTGQAVLRRLGASTGVIQVSFGPTLQDAAAEAAHRQALARLNDAIGGGPRYEFSAAPGAGPSFVAEIDPAAATCTAGPEPLRAATFVNLANGYISGGRLVYCTVAAARSITLVLHELGHTYGLRHSSSTSDVMFCSSGRPGTFSARERLVMSLMRQRRAGNQWPDNDRQATAGFGVGTGEAEVTACGDWNHPGR